jgi:hypothetical protein
VGDKGGVDAGAGGSWGGDCGDVVEGFEEDEGAGVVVGVEGGVIAGG